MRWTVEDSEFLIDNYGKLSIKDLVKKINHSKSSIKHKAIKLNLTEDHFWTEEENRFLMENYKKLSIKELENILNRSKGSIQKKSFRLNLTEKPNFWTKEELKFLKENYKHGKKEDLIKNINHPWKVILHKAFEISLIRERLSINENFFREWTSEMAWVFGFWIADGWMSGKNNCISFASNDFELLEIIKSDLKSEHKISKSHEKGYQLQINNKTLHDDLLKLGGITRKSLTIQFPDVPNEFLPDFIRGYLDGDGSNYIHRNGKYRYLATSFVGNVDFLTNLKDKIEEYVNIETGKLSSCGKKCNSRIKKLQYNGKKAKSLCDYIYQNSENYRLERKFEKYDQMKKECLKNKK